jgi:putative SOS response-associated peptidase YedK
MRELHDRQPIILEQAAYDDWLDPATPVSKAIGRRKLRRSSAPA